MRIPRALLAVSLASVAALAQTSPPGVTVAPARVEEDLRTRRVGATILVVNGEAEPKRISVRVAGLGHDLDGTPQFFDDAGIAAAVALSDESFTLAAGARREVALEGEIPAGRRGLYAGVLTEFGPLAPRPGVVEARARLASIFLVRGPRPWVQRIRVAGVGIVPGRPGEPATVHAAVRNTGDVHVRPVGRVRIFQGSRLLATVRLAGENVIPGFARRLTGTWTPPAGLSGPLRLEAVFDEPEARGRGTASFREGEVLAAAAEISALRARDEDGALVTLTLTNTGNLPIAPTVSLAAAEGGSERARTELVPPGMRPGESRSLAWRPDLTDGLYLIRAEARLGDRLLDAGVTGLRLGAAVPAGGGDAWILAVAVLVLLALALRLAAARRRRPPPPPAATPPASPPPAARSAARRPRAPGRRPVAVRPTNGQRPGSSL